MIKTLAVMIGSTALLGCAHIAEPLCLPSRPTLEPISMGEQSDIKPSTLIKLATNEEKLKRHVRTIERITEEHNKQFKAQCADEL